MCVCNWFIFKQQKVNVEIMSDNDKVFEVEHLLCPARNQSLPPSPWCRSKDTNSFHCPPHSIQYFNQKSIWKCAFNFNSKLLAKDFCNAMLCWDQHHISLQDIKVDSKVVEWVSERLAQLCCPRVHTDRLSRLHAHSPFYLSWALNSFSPPKQPKRYLRTDDCFFWLFSSNFILNLIL